MADETKRLLFTREGVSFYKDDAVLFTVSFSGVQLWDQRYGPAYAVKYIPYPENPDCVLVEGFLEGSITYEQEEAYDEEEEDYVYQDTEVIEEVRIDYLSINGTKRSLWISPHRIKEHSTRDKRWVSHRLVKMMNEDN